MVKISEDKLKPCPFCGAEIAEMDNNFNNEATHLIGMTNCFLTGVILKKSQWETRPKEHLK